MELKNKPLFIVFAFVLLELRPSQDRVLLEKTGFWQRVKKGADISNFVIFDIKPTMINNFAFDRKRDSTRRVLRQISLMIAPPWSAKSQILHV